MKSCGWRPTAKGVQVRGDRSRFKLPAQNPDEFPAVVGFEEEKYHKVSARLFRELIHRTLFATDTEKQPLCVGGRVAGDGSEKITAVATDGRRLAKMEGPAQSVAGHVTTGETMTIVPHRSMQLIERALTEAEAEIEVAARPNDVLIRTPKTTIYSRLVEGRFPKWRDVFPQRSQAVRIDVQVGPVYSALRQAAIVTDDESRGIDFQFGEGKLVLVASAAEVGESQVELPIPYDGQPIAVTMDHRFVSDFLRVLDPEKTFTIEIENEETAALFLTDDGYGYVVMPLARDADPGVRRCIAAFLFCRLACVVPLHSLFLLGFCGLTEPPSVRETRCRGARPRADQRRPPTPPGPARAGPNNRESRVWAARPP